MLVLGDVHVDLGNRFVHIAKSVELVEGGDGPGARVSFEDVVVALPTYEPLAALATAAPFLRPGGTIVGTVPLARNRRRLEAVTTARLPADSLSAVDAAGGMTRSEHREGLNALGLDTRRVGLIPDGRLDPVAPRPDQVAIVVESDDFHLKRVTADEAEELSAADVVFTAVKGVVPPVPDCSVVLAARAGSNPEPLVDLLVDLVRPGGEVIVVYSGAEMEPSAGTTWVRVSGEHDLAARWNTGARAARGRLLAFLSTDSKPSPSWPEAAIQAYISGDETEVVGVRAVGDDGTIEHAGLVLGADLVPYRVYQGEDAAASHANRFGNVIAVSAEGMVTGREGFVGIGGFDVSLEDDLAAADFCLRLRARGCPTLYTPWATLSSSPRDATGARDRFRRAAGQFVTRWSVASRSDWPLCAADGVEAEAQWARSWRLPRPSLSVSVRTCGLPAIAWTSHFLEYGGYTEEAVAAVEALDQSGLEVVANPMAWNLQPSPLPPAKAARLAAIFDRELPEEFVHVVHGGADRFKRHPAAMRNIGRTMFETDGLCALWRDQCNTMDEIWVPSAFNLKTFAAAGVAPSKLHQVPETFDSEIFQPEVTPLDIDGLQGFVFLSMFAWIDRKAWDVLLRAWVQEFGTQDDVTLLIKTDAQDAPGTGCQHVVESFVRQRLHHDPRKGAPIVVHDRLLTTIEMPRLYAAADAFVLASHGEGWGRPYMEAMAMGLPAIATRWSGNLEYMNDANSYLVGFDLVDASDNSWRQGQRWAQPSVPELRSAMRWIYNHREEAAVTGARARADVLVSCRPELVAEAVRDRLEAVTHKTARHRPPKEERLSP